MLRPFTQIQIQQIPTSLWTGRNLSFTLDFNTEYSIESTWEKHTDICKIKFPKNIALFNQPDGIFAYSATYNQILGGSGSSSAPNINAFGEDNNYAPLIMKGDIITINHGYLARDGNDNEYVASTGGIGIGDVITNNQLSYSENLFFGYVSNIKSDTPIEITCEDNFYLLKRTPFPSTVWNQKTSGSTGTSLYGLMEKIISLTNSLFHSTNPLYPELTLLNIPTSITAEFSLGYLDIGNITCGQLLDKLKQQYHFESTFRGNVLQFGFPIYIETTDSGIGNVSPNLIADSSKFFSFRDIYNISKGLVMSANIFPSHDLDYSNKDDIIITATVQCKIIVPTKSGKLTKSGQLSTKLSKLKAYIYWDIPTSTFKFQDVSSGVTPKTDIGDVGETHQFYYPVDKTKPNPTINDLYKLGIAQLKRYHYTGYRGCFTTFGIPSVQWNDNVNIVDPIYDDRNGQYKVKKVVYKGGMKGLSQEIHLDYKVDVPDGVTLPNNVVNVIMM